MRACLADWAQSLTEILACAVPLVLAQAEIANPDDEPVGNMTAAEEEILRQLMQCLRA